MTRRAWLRTAAGFLLAASAACGGGKKRQDVGVLTSSYGDHRLQQGDLVHGGGGQSPAPVVVLVHGGYWYPGYERDLMVPLATDLEARGYTTWNIGYRPAEDGSGWPYLLEDVAAAVDHLDTLAGEQSLDLSRVVIVGHSAGGQLALWAAARHRLPAGLPGAGPRVTPKAVVGLAPVADLAAAAQAKLGGRAAQKLLGGPPEEHPDRYAAASPVELVPTGVPSLLVHGTADDYVPIEQSRTYRAAALGRGDRVELVEVPDADHFAVINPAHPAWKAVTDRLPALLG